MVKPVDNSDLLREIQKLSREVQELRRDLDIQRAKTDPYIETLEALKLSGSIAIKVAGVVMALLGIAVALKNLLFK